ncbi:GroES-like protein [Peniophora sp. CONT]|nr:GroES-like protein [Peniophora sp. CONT]
MVSIPETIKALQVQDDRTVKVIEIPFASQEKVKNLPEDQVLVRVRVVGLNPTDWKHAIGDWGNGNTIAGCDATGDVVAVGSAVTHVKVGDRVAAFNEGGSWQTDNGAYAEYCRFIAAAVFVLPPGMTYEEGASFPIPHFTAVQALHMRFGIPKPLSSEATEFKKKGEKVLIWGGSTAVGHHAIQLAALSGLEVFATASPSAFDDVKALGASHVFDYKDPEVVAKIQEAAGEKGIIYAFDTVSEKGSTNSTIDAMSSTREGHLMILLPVPDESQNRRANVKVELALAYSVLGYPVYFAHAVHVDTKPEDKAYMLDYNAHDISRVLEGWQAGQGAPHFKTQKLRVLAPGFEGLEEGLKIMRDGAYGREKLVCKIA